MSNFEGVDTQRFHPQNSAEQPVRIAASHPQAQDEQLLDVIDNHIQASAAQLVAITASQPEQKETRDTEEPMPPAAELLEPLRPAEPEDIRRYLSDDELNEEVIVRHPNRNTGIYFQKRSGSWLEYTDSFRTPLVEHTRLQQTDLGIYTLCA